jgi:hypothetical protein
MVPPEISKIEKARRKSQIRRGAEIAEADSGNFA